MTSGRAILYALAGYARVAALARVARVLTA